MSTRKQNSGTLQHIHATILEHISVVKPLIENRQTSNQASVKEKLGQIASLAQSFTEQRSKHSKTIWSQLADSLDQEGVNLWNISGLIQKGADDHGTNDIAILRLAAFRLIEAGLETKPGMEALINILQLASKTGMGLADSGHNDLAAGVLTSAAKYEERLKSMDHTDEHRQAIACATVLYYSSRMEAAWKERNDSLAEYMSRKITDDDQRLALLPSHARELLAFKLHEIGRSFLSATQDGSKTPDVLQWLQRAFSVADKLEDGTNIAGLKMSILRTMARAYFLSEAYDRAESVLDELMPTIDSSKDHASSEYQELRWLRLAVLKRRKAGNAALLDAYRSVINHMDLSEASITEILQDLRALGHHHTLVTSVHQHVLELALKQDKVEPDQINRLLLSLIIHTSKDEDHQRAMKTLETTFAAVYAADVELPTVVSTACLTLIWQYGGRYYKSKKWAAASDWYMAGSHKLFTANSPSTFTKCCRKAVLCHIEQRDFALASTLIRRCPTNEAATSYIMFLIAIHQGLDSEAIRAIQDMMKAPDFDRKMLLLATQISHQSEMKNVLLVVLESLLRTLKIGTNGEMLIEAMSLMRCIVKLTLTLLVEPTANKSALIDTVVNQFRTARILTQAASSHNSVPLVYKEISWLWKTAYNCAVQGCAEWENAGDQISELFDIAREMLESCCHTSPIEIDADLGLHLANSSFAAVSGRVFSAREVMATNGDISDDSIRAISTEITSAKTRINDILKKNIIRQAHDISRVEYFVHALRVFQAEFAAQLKDWELLSKQIDELVDAGPSACATYEAIADILWLEKVCPVDVLYKCLEAILKASLQHSTLSVEKFSRWLRAICTISLSKNSATDRMKAIGYVEHAARVIEDHHDTDEAYPMDERQWLLATAFNTGTECLHMSVLDEAKRWFEVSTVICRFVPEGKQRAEKISETYTHLLSRYGNRT
ncbi:hypothetical protein CPC08DRAFT_261815 [Agrocybe pediades]|nr:hypothetical protein CPC08DRAFT_261815 [Agrocybe pediades]